MLFHVNAGDGTFAHADACSAVAGDETAEELEEIGIVADDKHVLTVGVCSKEVLEVGVCGTEIESRTDLDLAFIPKFIADELGGLQGALQRAGNDDIRLDLEGAQHTSHDHALFFAFRDKPPFGVELDALAGNTSIGMTHEVEVHNREAGVSGRVEPLPLSLNFNMFVTFLRDSPARQVFANGERLDRRIVKRKGFSFHFRACLEARW
jgi:hypothetical protein